MQVETAGRGFRILKHKAYLADNKYERLAQESSAIGDYEDSFDNPGSSYLWISEHHHLNREEVKQLIDHLNHWLETKRL